MSSRTSGNLGTQGAAGGMSQTPGVQPGVSRTGTPDSTFDLVSVLYHCLESASACQQYAQDAQGDQELTQFFQQCIQYDKQTADKAKQLIARRLSSVTTSGH